VNTAGRRQRCHFCKSQPTRSAFVVSHAKKDLVGSCERRQSRGRYSATPSKQPGLARATLNRGRPLFRSGAFPKLHKLTSPPRGVHIPLNRRLLRVDTEPLIIKLAEHHQRWHLTSARTPIMPLLSRASDRRVPKQRRKAQPLFPVPPSQRPPMTCTYFLAHKTCAY
jgi:hypothetical protein